MANWHLACMIIPITLAAATPDVGAAEPYRRVAPPAPPALAVSIDDRDILRAIEAELERQEGVEARQIDVAVENGVVTLRGVVASWFEVEQARREAFEAGARSVRSRLRVEPGASPAK